jgi:hypothetical protein
LWNAFRNSGAVLRNIFASVAQLVEQLTLNQLVCGSSPHRGTTLLGKTPCIIRGFSFLWVCASIVQWVAIWVLTTVWDTKRDTTKVPPKHPCGIPTAMLAGWLRWSNLSVKSFVFIGYACCYLLIESRDEFFLPEGASSAKRLTHFKMQALVLAFRETVEDFCR